MRKNLYQIDAKIAPQKYLHYNSFCNRFLLLTEENHKAVKNLNCEELKEYNPKLYAKLIEGEFLIVDDFDETEIVKMRKTKMHYNSSMYHVMINTTLDCNLNCWYCYENRVEGSYLKEEVISAIKKNIAIEYKKNRFETLKISFFGGEPFLYFKGIKDILSFSEEFANDKGIELIADFTTNATLIDENCIDFLKKYRCHFQITLDGDRKIHNKIKKSQTSYPIDTYQKTIDTLRMIDKEIANRWVAVRVNFDNRTLAKIDEIISDINFLDRKKTYVILKKVWQIGKEKVDKPLLHSAIQKFFDEKFLLDYYIMPKGHICFAERNREVLFNYDGKVFKCSTISCFDEKQALGELNFETGSVKWNQTKIAHWLKDILPQECTVCKWFPACLGPCNKQLLAHKGEHICTFDSINMNTEEFLVYSLKYHLLKDELTKTS